MNLKLKYIKSLRTKVFLFTFILVLSITSLMAFSFKTFVDAENLEKQLHQLSQEQIKISATTNSELNQKYQDTENEMSNRFATSRLQMLIMGIVIIVVLSVAGVVWSGVLTNALIRIVQSLTKVANGELNIEIAVDNYDEVGQLERSTKKMVEDLRHLVSSINAEAVTISASAQELTANTEQISGATVQVACAVQNINSEVQTQIGRTEQANREVRKLGELIRHNNTNLQRVAEHSTGTFRQAQQGSVAISGVVDKMQSINTRTVENAQSIKHLGDLSLEIGKIVDFISQLSSQTNLLALNAAIEAARAGEHGRGFSIVADEVRKLAEQSAESTQHIAKLIGEVQTAVEKAVASMELGTNETKVGMEVTIKAGEAFEEIRRAVEQVNNRIQEITTANSQMAVSSEAIIPIMEQLALGASTIGNATTDVNSAAQEQSASMSYINSNAEHLAKVSVQLQEIVKQFKL